MLFGNSLFACTRVQWNNWYLTHMHIAFVSEYIEYNEYTIIYPTQRKLIKWTRSMHSGFFAYARVSVAYLYIIVIAVPVRLRQPSFLTS